jgi:hypothetical protein
MLRVMATCPSCGEANSDRARFCSTCGSRQPEEGAGAEARKTITVVFCHLVGSTALGEGMDTEALTHLMSRYFDRMRPVFGYPLPAQQRVATWGRDYSLREGRLRQCRADVEKHVWLPIQADQRVVRQVGGELQHPG